jgi:copper chaperone CopZ
MPHRKQKLILGQNLILSRCARLYCGSNGWFRRRLSATPVNLTLRERLSQKLRFFSEELKLYKVASRSQDMAQDVERDQLAVIRIEGMHCHKCQQAIQKALANCPGVREVEVDFLSGQASILFDRGAVTIGQLMEAVNQGGYRATGFTQSAGDRA